LSSGPEFAGRDEQALFALLLVCAAAATVSVAVAQSALGLALLLALVRWARGRGRPARTGLEWPAALLAGWALATIPFSGEPLQSLVYARRFYLLAPLWLFATYAATERRRRWVLAALLAGAAAMALYGLARVAQRGAVGLEHRATLAQGYMTGGGLMMLAALVALAHLTAARRARARAMLAGALGIALAALVLTFTRSSWLGFLAGAAGVLGLLRARLLVPLAAAAALGLAVAPASVRERFASSFDPGHANNVQRVIMWKTGLRMLRDHPVTGVGDRDLKRLYRDYHAADDGVEIQGHLHNNLVQFGAIWGAPGLALGAWFLLAVAVRLFRARRAQLAGAERAPPLARGWTLAALGGWVAFNVAGLFEWNFGDAEVLLLAMLVAGVGLGGAGATAAPPSPSSRAP